MFDRANLELSRRKLRDRSIALVLAGTILLTPPVVGVSLVEATIGGLPVPLVYVFAVWVLLIVGAAFLAGPLRDSDVPVSPDEATDDTR